MTVVELLALLNKQGIALSAASGELRISAPKGSLTDELRSQLVEHKRELLELLSNTSAAGARIPRLANATRTDNLPLSFAQERLWFLDQLDEGSPVYNIPWAMRLHGELDKAALQRAVDRLLQRHESLRTGFITVRQEPTQRILNIASLPIREEQQHGATAAELAQQLTNLTHLPFNLRQPPLLRVHLLATGAREHVLLLVIHHIIADGWSMGVLMRDLAALYAAEAQHTTAALPALDIQYTDFAVWQRTQLQGARLDSELGYWRAALAGAPTLLELPADRPRPAAPSYSGDWATAVFPLTLLKQLQALALKRGTTLYMLLLAAFNVLLWRYTRQNDLLVGTPVAGRQQTETENLLGLFVNSVIVRSQLQPEMRFADLLTAVSNTTLDALSHQELPFEKLVTEFQQDRHAGIAPLFQVMFNLQNREQELVQFAGLESSAVVVETKTAKFDLNVLMEDRQDGLAAWFEYSIDLFRPETMERMLQHFRLLLEAVVANPDKRLIDLTLLDTQERQRILEVWNDTQVDYSSDATLITLFEQQVERTPDALALQFDYQSLTYRELNERANQLAHYLRSLGVGPESFVGVCMERSLELVISLYGILKAGAAYVPLDPDYPQERLAHMLQDAAIETLLCQARLADSLPAHRARTINLDTNWDTLAIGNGPRSNPALAARPDNAAYVIFTSGSTGRPKGVVNEHRGICNRLLWMQDQYQLDATDRVLQKTPFSFDVSVWEFFWPLQTGASLVVAEPGGHRDTAYLTDLIRTAGITTLHFVPSMLRSFLEDPAAGDCPALKRVFCSGEALAGDLVERFFNRFNAELHNLYGPTEAAVDVTYWQCQRDTHGATVPIGRPVANTTIYIVDESGALLPAGLPGELWIGGVQVARGYLNRPELTAERFIADPFAIVPGARVYRTGDLARYRDDGAIEFLGRIDFQIKLRGFRIELGEIEAELRQCAGVQQAAVILREDKTGDQRLVAYTVGTSALAATDLQEQLARRLPDYMLPAAFLQLDELPLTASGKLDRNALPAPDWSAYRAQDYVAPRSPVEEALCEIWSDLLGIEHIGIHDDFFKLGGHSLLATRLVARIRDTLRTELPLKTLFDHPTIGGLSTRLAANAGEPAGITLVPRPADQRIPLSASQQRLWILDQLEPGNVVYNIPWAIRLRGPLDSAALQTAIDKLVQRHESLRTRFVAVAGEPAQDVLHAARITLQQIDLSDAGANHLRAELTRLTQTPFALQQLPLVQFTLLHLGDADHILHIVMHHIIGDAWSTDVLLRDLAALYNAACTNAVAQLPALPVQFGDYATWQRERLREPALQRQLDYWMTQLTGAPAVLDLPTDRPRPAVQTYNGAWHELRLDAATTKALKTLANDQSATLYMVLLAAFDLLLHRYSGQNDIVIGTPIAGRQRTELDNLIGMFINTLCLRIQSDGNPQFSELLQQVKQKALDAYTCQEAPFEKLVEELHLVRDTSYAPLFQVMFILQNAPVTQSLFTQLASEPVLFEFGTAKLDLTLSMEERQGELVAYFEYNTDLFDGDTIARMARHFGTLLQQLAARPDAHIDELTLLGAEEREQMLVAWNATQSDYDTGSTLHGLFEQSVENRPDATALVYRDLRLSYRAVEQRANQLAHRLIALGARSAAPVAVSLRRSDEMLVALLGILKTGSAYVPLDPDFPSDRLRYMLEDCGATILVSESGLTGIAAGLDIQCVCLDQRDPQRDVWPDTPPNVLLEAGNLAYIIYTSGSTGKPKGVAITHRSVVNFLLSMLDAPGIMHTDRWLAVTTLSFDISILELFGPLAAGATVVLTDRATSADGFALGRLLEQERITVMQATPATWRMLLQTGWRGDQQLKILCGGEALDLGLAQQLVAASGSLWNMYGPTETTIWSTCERISADNSLITVGRPIANTACYILDERRQPVPTGVAGELYIGGDGVAQGYLNRETLTQEKFVADPFAVQPGARMYRTSDLARHLPDGRLVVLGRTDFQVKLRGFRIELGEIEAQLAAQPGISQAVVILREDNPRDQRLVAYLTGDIVDTEILRSKLHGKLPDYMVPSAYVRLDTLPLTPNGKIDRKQLPAPEWSAKHEYVAPRTELERSLADIWADVLGLEKVGVYDNFFALGGHSLLATRLISRILDVLDIEIPLMTLFNQPSIDALASALSGNEKSSQRSNAIRRLPRTGKLPLSFAQQRLWFLDQLSPGDPTYNIPWVMRLRGEPNRRALQKALDQIIARHESLRTIFPSRDGEPVQVILPEVCVAIREEDFRGQNEMAIQTRLTELAQQRMHVAEGPLLYITLVRTDDSEYLLALIVHHIIFDVWSHGILLNELAIFYNAENSGTKVVTAPLVIEFADYASWQREWFDSADSQHQLQYWKNKLADAPRTLDLPTDHPRPPVQTNNGANIARMLPDELSTGVLALAKRKDCSLFMVLLAAFNVLMSRYSGQDDLLVGTPISGRKRIELEKIVGFFLNTLVIRADLSGNPSFHEFLARTRQTVLEAFAHQEIPFETLVEALEPERDMSRHPLFQAHFVLQHVKIDWEMFAGLRAEPVEFEFGTAKFDIMFFVFEVDNTLSVSIEYNTDLFDRSTIERLLTHFETLLGGIVRQPDAPLSQLPLLDNVERQHLLRDFNNSAMPVRNLRVHALVEQQVAATPEAVSLVMNGTSLSYAELNARANRLAHYLLTLGVGPGQLVGIACERSIDMAVSVLAVLKSGAAYVPIDPNYPAERVGYMLDESKAPVLLTQSALAEQLPATNATVVCVDTFDFLSGNDTNPGLPGTSVYAIYTSGSTGLPKGVELTHAGLSNLIQWQLAQPGLNTPARTLQFASLSFDVSFQELFTTWAQGGTVVLVDEELRRDLPRLAKFIATDAIERVYLPYAALQPLADSVVASGLGFKVKDVIVAGEQLQVTPIIKKMFGVLGDARLHNHYGPSETHVVTAFTLSGDPAQWMPLPPIGTPVANTHVYVLDGNKQPVPVGVPGELYLSGVQVAKGYIHRPALTAEKFLPDPFNPGSRMYKTGDRVRFLADGNLEYLGRTDDQVKWRGFRIEPGEIEAKLAEHSTVQQAAVLLREDVPGDKRLVAYLVAAPGQSLDTATVKTWLKDQLPDYMVPSAFVVLERLPLTPSGKVARRLLPVPDYADTAQAYVAPRTPAEEQLAQIWSDILGVKQIGVHDDFFALGGHSLLATQLISRIRDRMRTELPLITLFNHPTIAGLAIEATGNSASPASQAITPCDHSQPLPLSFSQQRLWFLDQLEGRSATYNVPLALALEGHLDVDALQRSVDTLVERHESLRTQFAVTRGEPVQIVRSTLTVPVDVIYMPGATAAAVQARLEELAQTPFDLAADSLLRVHVLQSAPEQNLLLVILHHIVSDGWSLGILVRELAELYAGHCAGKPVKLRDLPVQYPDYAVWQRGWLAGKELQRQLAYWKHSLDGAPALLQLPTDHPRPAVQTFRGAHINRTLSPELGEQLRKLSEAEDATLFMTLLTAFSTLLKCYSGSDDIVIGTPIAGRTRSEIEGLIGFFVNMLAMRTDLTGDPSFVNALSRVRRAALDAYAHQELPFEKLVEELQPERDTSHPPIFQVLFVLQETVAEQIRFHELKAQHLDFELGSAKFDLSMFVVDLPDGLITSIEYNTDLFDSVTIERMLRHYEALLKGIVANPQQRVSELPLLDTDEQALLRSWNDTARAYPRNVTLVSLFEQQVRSSPSAPALVFSDESLTYAELNARANQLARHLRNAGVGPDSPVGVCLERSIDLVVALLGILKAGGAYVPLDPEYPAERLGHMLEDAQVRLLITQASLVISLPQHQATTLMIDASQAIIRQLEDSNLAALAGPDNLAYIIFTSGSTGRPKGVMNEHHGICNRLLWMQEEYGLTAADRVLQKTPFSFDVSVWEFFWPLITGARLVLAEPGGHRDTAYLARLIESAGITTLHFVPPMLQVFLQDPHAPACRSLQRVICSGEALSYELQERFFAVFAAELHNLYGPTEAAIDVTYWACQRNAADRTVPIGRPVANTALYIVDANGKRVPIRVPGELWIGGEQVARGYINRPELSAAAFIADPFSTREDARVYRTGDLVRWRADGAIEFLGRIDHQVKLRGFRIELGEIEAQLDALEGIGQSVVLLREDTPGLPQLVAYVIMKDAAILDAVRVKTALGTGLPDYMIPAAIIAIDKFPLSPNGKLDRKALPAPERSADTTHAYVAPRTPVEEALVQIWAEVLKLPQVGIHDDFFDLGGHSLLATQLISRVRDTLNVELPLITLFNRPTIAEFVIAVGAAQGETPLAPITPCDRSQPLPLSFAQQRLWFLDQLEPGNPVYNIAWAMRLHGPLNMRALQASINDLVARHETLRTLFSVTMGKPQQCILARTQVPIESIDATGDTEVQIETRLRSLSRMPFGLTQTPLMRVHVLHVANQEHVILLVLHHIISDGWSLSVLYRELAKLYAGYCTGEPATLPALPVHYADYSVWQHAWFRSGEQQRQLQYWKKKLLGAPEILDLPTDRPRGATQTYNGAFIEQVLPAAIHQGLRGLAQDENSTLFMVCLAAFNVLLSRYSGQSDICVGIPIAGRKQTELEGLIGFFINTLVLRADLSGNPEFAEFLAQTKHAALEAFAHQELPFEKLVDEIHPVRDMSHAPLFQVAFIFQNTPWDQAATLHGLEISPIELDYGVAKFDLSLVMAERREGLLMHFEYNTDLFDRETVERLTGHFETLLLAIVSDSHMRVSELPLLTASERQRILFDWNDTAVPYADESCIHTLIEQRAAEQPDAPAILFEETTVSCRELNERANQIAHYLLAKGAGPGTIIGLCIERSVDLVAGLLGIFKSGAAYVPLDPNYPSDRLEYMLADSAAPLLLSQSPLLQKLPAHSAEVICLDTDWPAITRHSIENPATRATASDLAYVIYTSGSTGKPKGVMIEHRGVCNLADAQSRCFGLEPGDRMLQFASISFDASIFEIVMGLQVGAAMVLAPQDDLLPGDPLLQVLRRHAVTAVTLPPTALNQLPSSDLPALHTITVAGEACPPELVQQWGKQRRFFNLYGPTESTVWASYQLCMPGEPVTIGRPISNARLYILDQYQQAVPVGVAGELCIGGAGLARGYLHRPELTAEKFLPDPFRAEADARIYRSGDLVRYRRDGNIEFLGRIDHQVKVRGFRIELGEIETTLAARDDIREAVVVARGDSLQERRLVAYIIPQGNRELSLSALRSYLKETLPEFMIPGAFVVLDAFPLTPNGKVDRQALPSPDEQRLALEVEFIAPRTPIEQTLADIWQQLLNVERVGSNDNFFELGGDSILSIQIIARAAQAGIRLTPKQLFQHQTIAELALEAGSETVAAEQGTLTGPVALTPIQHWFVQRELSAPGHFNQSMLLESSADLDASTLEKALHALLQHHDALRLRLIRTPSGWSQTLAAVDEAQSLLQVVGLTDIPMAEQNAAWDQAAEQLQAGFDLANGPLLRALLCRRGPGTKAQLLIAAHHIAVDWVSWNILLEDLQTAYRQLNNNEPLQLPAKTSSFRAWSEHLHSHARTQQLLQQRDYWLTQDLQQAAVLPRDHAAGENTEISARAVTVELPAELTTVLLQELPRTWRSRINEALLAAVLRAVNNWTGANSIAVNLEGHGREELFDDIDLSRTVGWFTSLYPVLLQTSAHDNPAQTLQTVKNAVRGIPDSGIGYGILRYLTTESLTSAGEPEIGFNYLGQFDQLTSGDSILQTSLGYRGHEQSPAAIRPHVLDIHSVITGGQLQVSLIYSENLHTQPSIAKLAESVLAELRALAVFCQHNAPAAYSPADFPLTRLDQATLDRIIPAGERVDDVYRVTSLQHGMLFHSLFTGEKDVYFARFSWRLSGTIDREAFAEAWQQVVNRHTSLRTSFYWEGLRQPVQIVHSRQTVTLQYEDWSAASAEEQAQRLQDFLTRDQLERFDFTHAPLLRLVLIRLGESDHRFIWSFHHAIVDGWSVPLVLKDVFKIYDALRHGEPAQLPEARPFSDYIAWLEQQDGAAAKGFWTELMRGFTAPTPLPGARAQAIATVDAEEFAELQARLPANTVRRLREISQQQRLTLNTVVQGAWALLLSRYSGEADVVFGATTSGRPAAMPGVESMIGLFLNTLPLRAQIDPAADLLQWLHTLQTLQLEVRQYEYASLVEIQGWSNVPRGTPMFESLLAFENYPEMETMWTSTESINIREMEGFDRTNFPLTVNVAVFDEMHMRIAYAQERFEAATMSRLVEHFMALLTGIAEQPERSLAELPMLTAAETALLDGWNETTRDYPRDVTLVSLIEQQVAATPNAIAVAYETEQLTYAELNGRANQLARYLRNQGVAPDAPVGVCLERSIDLVIALLGILKAGGAYVPLDPEYPAERLAHMLEDAHVSLLITQPALASSLPTHSAKTLVLDEQRAAIAQLDASNLPATATPANLAYIIFTSGSTGRPKGVMNEHHGICNRLLWMQEEYQLTADDRVLQKTPFSFDVSVWEFFWPLISGARLVLAAPGGHRDTGYLTRLIASTGITTLHFVPPMLQVFLQDPHAATCTSIQRVICSGEALPYELQERFFGTFAAADLHNLYGPTEAAVDVTYWACQRDTDDRTVPIGWPVANTLLYIVDAGGKRVPIDVPGELWIGGAQVARGYINRPELTAASFIRDPFSTEPGARVYRTGDLVRWRADGAVEFLGRIDHQVKLRGFRIELGEIEAQLDALADISQSVVLLREDVPGLRQLVAYVITADGQILNAEEARTALGRELPDYMVPAAIIAMDRFPLSPNGKLDRKALPAPDAPVSSSVYTAPESQVEEQLAAMWAELLGTDRVGIHDDFFALGGHSLVAMQLVSRIMIAMQVELPLDALFNAPTIAGLARSIDERAGKPQDDGPGNIRAISRAARRTRKPR